jgi:hypothetical protein
MMTLLIDYLEEAADWLRKKKERLRKLDAQYRHAYDRDLKREMAITRQEIRKKSADVSDELMYDLDELQYLRRYYPELLTAFAEDENVGPLLRKKDWLLDFRPLPPQEAAMELEQLKQWRAQLREAKKSLRGAGRLDTRSLTANYPILNGHVKGQMERQDVLAAIDELDHMLLRKGWLILLTDTLIEIPLTRFVMKFNKFRYEETAAKEEVRRARGKGTVAEANALKKLQGLTRQREHYERMVRQLLLANPGYLRSLKKKDWLSRGKQNTLQRMAQNVTPHTVKERVWLNEMRKRLEA